MAIWHHDNHRQNGVNWLASACQCIELPNRASEDCPSDGMAGMDGMDGMIRKPPTYVAKMLLQCFIWSRMIQTCFKVAGKPSMESMFFQPFSIILNHSHSCHSHSAPFCIILIPVILIPYHSLTFLFHPFLFCPFPFGHISIPSIPILPNFFSLNSDFSCILKHIHSIHSLLEM